MADLRIVDAPEIPTENITGEEKLPTGGNGNYSISLYSLADYTKTKKDLADNTAVDTKVNSVRQELEYHVEDLLNPHQVTKGQIGLGNVDNTADADKPVSNSTQAAIISAVAPKSDKTYVDNQLTIKANKADVYTKAETYTKQESNDLVSSSISTALTPVNSSLQLAKRGVLNRYDSSLTYNSDERVVLNDGDIVRSTIDGNTNDPNVNMTGWLSISNTGEVESIADLIAIPNPKNGNRVYVKSVGQFYTYSSTNTENENGVTVASNWIMQPVDCYYASWFAQDVSQSTAPQQDALQVGYKYAASKGKPFIVDKGFFVESSLRTSQDLLSVQAAVLVEPNSTLVFSNSGYLRHIDTAATNYTILSTFNAENFTVICPKLIGDKDTHLGSTGEWGYGMAVVACRNGVVFEPNISNCWGDGIYIGQEYWNGNGVEVIPKNINIIRPTIKNVRRNGIALCAGEEIFIDAPHIDGVSGIAPEACIDIEPEEADGALVQSYLKKVVIRDAMLLNGRTYGVLEAIFKQRIVDVHFKGTTTISGCQSFIATVTNSTTSTIGIVKYDHVCVDHAITGLSKGSLIVNSNVNKGFTTTIDQLDLRMYNDHIFGVVLDADSSVGDGGNFLVNKVNVSRIENGQLVNKEVNFRRSNTSPINYKNFKLPLPDYLQYKSYDNVGVFSMQDNCNIGCFDNLSKATINYSELFATTNYMTPVDNGSGAVWAQVVGTPVLGREYNIKLLQSVTSIGSGLIIMLPNRTSPNRIESTSFNAGVRITNINGIVIDSYSGNWSYPA